MVTSTTYLAAAQAYAEATRELFAPARRTPTGLASAERGGPATPPSSDLASRAGALAAASDQLAAAATTQLSDADPTVRAQASAGLLAKALNDLTVSAYLLRAAQDEEDGLLAADPTSVERGGAALPSSLEANLGFLLSAPAGVPRGIDRADATPRSVDLARVQLDQSAGDALDLISERAAQTGQAALGGLLGLGVAELGQAAGIVGLEIAGILGQADKVTKLYGLFRDFVLRTYGSLLALLGPGLAQMAAQQVMSWIDEVRNGKQFAALLGQLYATDVVSNDVRETVANSQSSLDGFVAALQGVDGLNGQYQQQIALSEKLLKGLKLLGGVPAAVLPQGMLLMAAAYIVLGAYVILAGADYVDSPKLTLLHRTPGVRTVVQTCLAAGAASGAAQP
jgi:hypothetical protein